MQHSVKYSSKQQQGASADFGNVFGSNANLMASKTNLASSMNGLSVSTKQINNVYADDVTNKPRLRKNSLISPAIEFPSPVSDFSPTTRRASIPYSDGVAMAAEGTRQSAVRNTTEVADVKQSQDIENILKQKSSPFPKNYHTEFSDTSLDSLSRLLSDICLHSEYAAKRVSEPKFQKTFTSIKDAFHYRIMEIQTLRTEVPSNDSSLVALNQLLFDFHTFAHRLNSKLVKDYGGSEAELSGGVHRSNLAANTKILLNKKKLLTYAEDFYNLWTKLMLQIALMLAGRSSKIANEATHHVAQLAVATGASDWSEITLDDAGKLYIQGDKYLFGFGLPQSYELAYRRYMTASEAGLPEAMNMLGLMHENGLGRQKDVNLALQWYRSSDTKGCSDATNNLGRMYQNGIGMQIDFAIAREWYLKASQNDHLDAMVNLGFLLQHGLGGDVDYINAFHWYQCAANKEFAKAQNALGSAFYCGLSGYLERNPEEAVQWFRRAAIQGNSHALNNLGICYEEGLGVSKDCGIAKQFYKEASALQHPNATNNYGYMLLQEQEYDLAINTFHLAIALGSSDASYNLGTMYETGCDYQGKLILNADIRMAIKYYTSASELGHIQSDLRVGTILLTGPSEIVNYSMALKHLLKAADVGDHPDAQNLVGQMKELGIGNEKADLLCLNSEDYSRPDVHAARFWYKKAASQGNAAAMYNLACLYETGSGVERDMDHAISLFQTGAKAGNFECRSKLSELEQAGII